MVSSKGGKLYPQDKLALLRRAGEVLAGVKSFDELCRLVDEFRRGLGKLPKGAPFAPVQLVFERRRPSKVSSTPESEG